MGEVVERVTGNGKFAIWVRGMKFSEWITEPPRTGNRVVKKNPYLVTLFPTADSSLAFSALFNKQYKVSQAECVH